MLNQPPVRAHQRNGTIFLKARPPLLCQGGECCSFKSRSSPETGRAPATRLGGECPHSNSFTAPMTADNTASCETAATVAMLYFLCKAVQVEERRRYVSG